MRRNGITTLVTTKGVLPDSGGIGNQWFFDRAGIHTRTLADAAKVPHPMPIAITFFAGQGEEPTLIKIGAAYESATHHRTPPPAFGPAPAQLGRTHHHDDAAVTVRDS